VSVIRGSTVYICVCVCVCVRERERESGLAYLARSAHAPYLIFPPV
jgi:hypothetical protein